MGILESYFLMKINAIHHLCLILVTSALGKVFDEKVFDCSAVVHFLPTAAVKTFEEYAEKIFLPLMVHHLNDCNRIDCIWDCF